MLSLTQEDSLFIKGGRVIDPSCGRDEIANVAVVGGKIADNAPANARVIEAGGLIVCPGLIDLHVHLRDPGQTHKETIETGTAAAAAGGFTFIACMPNTKPTLDHPDVIRSIIERALAVDQCEVGPVAAITRDRAGREVTDFASLTEAGAVAFSDDGTGVQDDAVMRSAFESAATNNALLIQHCEDNSVGVGGVMHLGEVSQKLGFPGIDPRCEEAMIERDLDLCRKTGGRYHVSHISTRRAVELVRRAKAEGLPVTAEACTHHLVLTDESCLQADPNTKMHPPLRTSQDVDACRQGLVDSTIDCIATDHAPHTEQEKAAGFLRAPPGIVGLETAVGLAARAMIDSGLADWSQLVRWLTSGPKAVLARSPIPIQAGQSAILTMIDPNASWTVDPSDFLTKGRNTPFGGWKLGSKAVATIRGRSLATSGKFVRKK